MNPYLEYLSIFMQSPKVAEKLSDLIDCLTLNDLLSMIPEFPQAKIQDAPLSFAQLFSNLKTTYRRIEHFWNESLNKELETGEIDLVDIAHNANERQFTKLIDIFIQSVVLSSKRDFFLSKMLETSLPTQQFLKVIVEQTLNERKTFSPRKKREQRLFDKMVELEHQNENLQNVVTEICQQKFEIEQKYRQLYDKIAEKDSEILKLTDETTGLYITPQRKRLYANYDSIEKNNEYIERLKSKIIQMVKDHEKQLYNLNQKIQCYSIKLNKFQDMQNQIEMYQVRLQTYEQTINEFEQTKKKYVELKLSCIQKDEMISQYKNKVLKQSTKIRELEEQMFQKNLEIERRNTQIEERSRISSNKSQMEDSFLKITPISLKKAVSVLQSDSISGKIDDLYASNITYKSKLDEAELIITQNNQAIDKLKKRIENLQVKNKKLSDFIEERFQQDQIMELNLRALKMHTRDRQIRQKLESTLGPNGKTSRICGSRRSKNKQNIGRIDNEEDSYGAYECYSIQKTEITNRKRRSIQGKKTSIFCRD